MKQIEERAPALLAALAIAGALTLLAGLGALNAQEDCRPAVIGLDVLFAGETDPAQDAALVEAAARYGNVIAACADRSGADDVEDLSDRLVGYRMDSFVLQGFERPYAALAQAVDQGHINAMLDGDGILRRHLLSGEADSTLFARKIVLIGPYASGLQDSYLTAVDHTRPMYGVEFQANAVQVLL